MGENANIRENPQTTQLYARLSVAAAREEYDRAMRALGSAKKGDNILN